MIIRKIKTERDPERLVYRDLGSEDECPELQIDPEFKTQSIETAISELGFSVVDIAKVVNRCRELFAQARDKAQGAHEVAWKLRHEANLQEMNGNEALVMIRQLNERIDQLEKVVRGQGGTSGQVEIKTLPCANCKSITIISAGGDPFDHWVECEGCGACGPIEDSPARAALAWNRLVRRQNE